MLPVWSPKERSSLPLTRTEKWRRSWTEESRIRMKARTEAWLRHSRMEIRMHLLLPKLWLPKLWLPKWWSHPMHQPVWVHVAVIKARLSDHDNLRSNRSWRLSISAPASTPSASAQTSRSTTSGWKHWASRSAPGSSSLFQSVQFSFWFSIIWHFLWWRRTWLTSHESFYRTFWAPRPSWTSARASRTTRRNRASASCDSRTWRPTDWRTTGITDVTVT